MKFKLLGLGGTARLLRLAHFGIHPLLEGHEPFRFGGFFRGDFLMKNNLLLQPAGFGLAATDLRLQGLMHGLAAIVIPADLFQRFARRLLSLPRRAQLRSQSLHFTSDSRHPLSGLGNRLFRSGKVFLGGFHLMTTGAGVADFATTLPTTTANHPAVATNDRGRGPLAA